MPDIKKEYFIYLYIELIIGLISLIRSSDTAASCDKKCRLDPISFNFAAQGYHQRHPPVLFLGTTLFFPFFVFFFYHCICLCACFFLFYFLSLIRSGSTLRCTAITTQNFVFVFLHVLSCICLCLFLFSSLDSISSLFVV